MKTALLVTTCLLGSIVYAAEPATPPASQPAASQPALSDDALLLQRIVEMNKKAAASNAGSTSSSGTSTDTSVMNLVYVLNNLATQLNTVEANSKNDSTSKMAEKFDKIKNSASQQYDGKSVSFDIIVTNIAKSTNDKNAYNVDYEFKTNNSFLMFDKKTPESLKLYVNDDVAKTINNNSKINITGTIKITIKSDKNDVYFTAHTGTASRKKLTVIIDSPVFKVNDKEVKTNFTDKK